MEDLTKELLKWQLVNSAETIEDLKKAITNVAEDGIIVGRKKNFMLEQQLRAVDAILAGYSFNFLTRSYGIRQQMMYLMFYRKV